MLRSAVEVMGLPALAGGNLAKVVLGNKTLRSSISIAAACLAQRVPFCVENPSTSFMWLAPAMLWLGRRHAVNQSITDFCGYGMPWRKRTGLMHFMLEESKFTKVCHRRGGLCSFSH